MCYNSLRVRKYAGLAQPVERLIRNHEVGGSNPPSSSKKTPPDRAGFFWSWMGATARCAVEWMEIDWEGIPIPSQTRPTKN